MRRWRRRQRRSLENDGIARSKIALAARSRRALRRAVDGSARAGAGRRDRRGVHRRARPTRSTPRISRPSATITPGQQKVELVNFCVSGFGVIDRPRIPKLAMQPARAAAATSRPVYFDGEFRDTPVYARASLGAGASARRARRSSRSSARPRWYFRASSSKSIRTGILDRARCRQSSGGQTMMNVHAKEWPWPTAPDLPRARGRSDRAADRRRHAEFDRGRDRIRHRAHRALADDPRSARLSRRPVRPLLPQAHRALLFGDAERRGARFSARDDAARRRVPDERHLSDRRLDRPPAGSVQHRAGVPSRRGRRLHPGLRPP